MRTSRGILPAAAGIAIVFFLAGCGATPSTPDAGPTTAASDPASSVPSQTPTPTPTPTPTTRPTLAQLVLSPDGLGDLVMGQPVPSDAPAVSPVKYSPNLCEGTTYDPIPGWIANYPGRPFSLTTTKETRTGAVGLIFVASPRIETSSAIHVGSTLAELTAAYGTPDRIIHANASDLYVIKGTHGQLAFDVAKQITFGPKKTPYWTAGEVGTVQSITVVPTTATPISYVGIDAPGGCA